MKCRERLMLEHPEKGEKEKICPLMRVSGPCIGEECAWYCGFARECAIPLLAGMFADSDVCRNVFEED